MTGTKNEEKAYALEVTIREILKSSNNYIGDPDLYQTVINHILAYFRQLSGVYADMTSEQSREIAGRIGSIPFEQILPAVLRLDSRLQKTIKESSDRKQKLMGVYEEKSELSKKLKITYEEKAERGKQIRLLKEQLVQSDETIKQQKTRLKQRREKIERLEKNVAGLNNKLDKTTAELEHLQNLFIIRAGRKIKGIFKRK